jgi:phthalate 4,5-dioxygenase
VLTVEDNEAITKVGPGTLMGNFMREYWLPAALSSELPHPDCDPLRVKMLGEELIGFRDTSGRVGLIQNLCPHRGTSLFFGRNEQDGIRCIYHAWKFDVTGQCVDMPNEPPQSTFKNRIKAVAYPCQERGGFVWVYMGSREVPPPLPDIEASFSDNMVATGQMVPCNWLQVMEGNIDTIHAAFLHLGASEYDWYPEGSFNYYMLKQRWASFVAADTDYGAIYGAYRPGPEGQNYWRIGHFMFPCWSSPPTGVLGHKVEAKCWVPIDDTHTIVFRLDERREGARPESENPDRVPNTTDWYGRFNAPYNMENDFFINREEQRELGSFTGMGQMERGTFNANNEDSAVQVAMGSVLPREIEHLGTSDLMVIRVRQRLLEAARAYAEHKTPPPALDTPEVYAARTGSVYIPEDADWLEYIEPLVKPFVDHGPVDPNLDAGPGFKTLGYHHERVGPMF